MNKEKGKITSFTQLNAWKEGHRLVVMVYKVVKDFPPKETFALVNQMCRSSVSITSNIAEGFSRQSYKEKIQFYFMALGSLTELQNQLLVARDVGYISRNIFSSLAHQSVVAHKIISGLIKKSKLFPS